MSPRTPVRPSASRQPRRWCSPARVVIAVLIVTKVPRLRSAGWAAALGLLLAGAAGNLCDRLMRAPGIGRGAVAGFIDLQHFADFNIADSCLTCGAVARGLAVAPRHSHDGPITRPRRAARHGLCPWASVITNARRRDSS